MPDVNPRDAARRGRVLKVLLVDSDYQPVAKFTQQLEADPFEGRSMQGLVQPPIDLQQLIFLADAHPVHSSALEQKTADVVGMGWVWDPKVDGTSDEPQRGELDAWLSGLAGDERTVLEMLAQVWLDVETLNVGYFEISRDSTGAVRSIFPVPAHTVRFHKDGKRLAQVRDTKKVWFARWGALAPGQWVDRRGHLRSDEPALGERANELLVLRRNTRRTVYGVPGYISALGWITLAVAIRDDNLHFFGNRREPRWAIILTNLEDDDTLDEDIRQALTVDHQQPHRNMIIPISGPGTVEFKQLSNLSASEGSFESLDARADARILVGHRIPPERLGMNRVGPLGGNVAEASSEIYREAVISTSQALLASRINRFIEVEFGRQRDAKVEWTWRPEELDLSEEREDIKSANDLFTGDVITLNEARARLGVERLPDEDERGGMLRSQLKAKFLAEAKLSGDVVQSSLDDSEARVLSDHARLAAELNEEIHALLHGDDGQQDPTATPV